MNVFREIANAVCALTAEVRALRVAIENRSQPAVISAPAPLPAPTPAKSERIRYPFCYVCNRHHHPDDETCLIYQQTHEDTHI